MWYRDLFDVNPFQEMNRIQREMNRLFDAAGGGTAREYPAVNIWSNAEAAVITAELPGYDPKAVSLSVLSDTLTIRGKRPVRELKEGEEYLRQERACGEFERSIRLPFSVENEKVEARFKNGVLNILLPRAEADKPRKIQIKTQS